MNRFFYLLVLMFLLNGSFSRDIYADSFADLSSDTLAKTSVDNVLDSNKIKELSLLPRFQYKKTEIKQSGFAKIWDEIVTYVQQKISQFFENIFGIKVSKTTSSIIFWIFVFLLLMVILLVFLQTKRKLLTTSGKKIAEESSLDLEDISYIKKIEIARSNEDYKLAIRYILLHSLQQLAEKDIIRFIPGKTLFEYQYDFKNKESKKLFIDICYIYEYIWFGNFNSSKLLMDEMFAKMTLLLTPQTPRR